MVSDRDLRYYSNYYDIINKLLSMKVSLETCFCIPEVLEGEEFESLDENTLSKLKQLAEELYDEIKDFVIKGQYKQYLPSLVKKQFPFLEEIVIDKLIYNCGRHYYL